jgi:hypothetical protein
MNVREKVARRRLLRAKLHIAGLRRYSSKSKAIHFKPFNIQTRVEPSGFYKQGNNFIFFNELWVPKLPFTLEHFVDTPFKTNQLSVYGANPERYETALMLGQVFVGTEREKENLLSVLNATANAQSVDVKHIPTKVLDRLFAREPVELTAELIKDLSFSYRDDYWIPLD